MSAPIPPPHEPLIDKDGRINDVWYRFLEGNLTALSTVEGTLATPTPISGGGTGSTTATAAFDALAPSTVQGSIIYKSSTNWVALAPGTTGQFLQTGGSGANPAWGSPNTFAAYANVNFVSSYSLVTGSNNISSVSSTGVGLVTVNLSGGAVASSNYIVLLTGRTNGIVAAVTTAARSTASFAVGLASAAAFGGAADSPFYLAVINA